MLERLDHVNWARLGHAYGSAADVPDQIRALRSPDAERRRRALWELYGNIFHQGTRYEATAYAVPFLLELVAAPDTPGRADLVALLTALAIGYDETWLPEGLPIAEHRRIAAGGDALLADAPRPGDDDFDDEGDYAYMESLSPEDQNRLDAHVAVAAYDAVRAGVPLFRALLTEDDPALRTIAAYALSWFSEDASGSLPALTTAATRALSDPDDAPVAATCLVAAGLLGGAPDVARLDDPRPLIRWGATVALARVCGANAPQGVVDELLTWTSGNHDDDQQVPFLDGDLAGYAGLALAQVGPGHADATFDALLARIPAVSGIQALHVVAEALRLAFPGGRLPEETPFAALDDRQRRLVKRLVGSPDAWRIDGAIFANFGLLVGEYGLPHDQEKLRAYAGASD